MPHMLLLRTEPANRLVFRLAPDLEIYNTVNSTTRNQGRIYVVAKAAKARSPERRFEGVERREELPKSVAVLRP